MTCKQDMGTLSNEAAFVHHIPSHYTSLSLLLLVRASARANPQSFFKRLLLPLLCFFLCPTPPYHHPPTSTRSTARTQHSSSHTLFRTRAPARFSPRPARLSRLLSLLLQQATNRRQPGPRAVFIDTPATATLLRADSLAMSNINITEVLSNSLAPDTNIRSAAEAQLEQLQSSNYPEYLLSLSNALSSSSSPGHIRSSAGIAIKNALSAKDTTRQDSYSARWRDQLDDNTRNSVKQAAFNTLGDKENQPRLQAGQIVAAIASIELNAGQGLDIIPQLLQFVHQQENTGLRQGALQAIGLVCERIVS